MTGHPATFSVAILDALRTALRDESYRLDRQVKVLDPFCGVGTIHRLRGRLVDTTGFELEPEWAREAEKLGLTFEGDALALLLSLIHI